MAEVLVQFDPPVTDEEGRTYVVRICGGVADDRLWEGWIEFAPADGGTTLRTPRETEQPNRADLEYWASGLTLSYLEGALDRARNSRVPDLRPRTVAAQAAYDGPAASAPRRPGSGPQVRPRAVLDPFAVYGQGEEVLREELSALDAGHLRNIIQAYSLAGGSGSDRLPTERAELAELIVRGVKRHVD